jgi:hypothetical protein
MRAVLRACDSDVWQLQVEAILLVVSFAIPHAVDDARGFFYICFATVCWQNNRKKSRTYHNFVTIIWICVQASVQASVHNARTLHACHGFSSLPTGDSLSFNGRSAGGVLDSKKSKARSFQVVNQWHNSEQWYVVPSIDWQASLYPPGDSFNGHSGDNRYDTFHMGRVI